MPETRYTNQPFPLYKLTWDTESRQGRGHVKNRCHRSVDPRHDAGDSHASIVGGKCRIDNQIAVFVVLARYPYLCLVVGLTMAQRRIGAFVRHELARHCLQDCPRTPSRDAADTVDDQGADASLCAVADAAPIRVVVQVDLSGVLVYGITSRWGSSARRSGSDGPSCHPCYGL